MSRSGFEGPPGRRGSRGARRGPNTPGPESTRPFGSPARRARLRAPAWAVPQPHSPWRGRGVRNAGIKVPPAAAAAAAARAPPRVRASTLTARSARRRHHPPQRSFNGRRARAPPRPAPPRPARVPPHCGSHGSLRAPLHTGEPARPAQGRVLPPGARARARASAAGLLSVAARPARCAPVHGPPRRRGTARRRVTRPCVSRAAIGSGPWRK